MSVSESRSFQRTAWILSIAGLVPFALPSIIFGSNLMGAELTPEPYLFATALYGAIILSFLGGIRWGIALMREEAPQDLILSVAPSLLGWVSFLLSMPMQLIVLATAFAAQWYWDYQATSTGTIAPWFGKLRTIISVCVIAFLLLSFLLIL